MRNKSLLLLALVIIVIAFMGCSQNSAGVDSTKQTKKIVEINASYRWYDHLDELSKDADLIIEGKIIDSQVVYLDLVMKVDKNDPFLNPNIDGIIPPDYILHTVHDVEILHKYKDKSKVQERKVIQVKQLGGETDTTIYHGEDPLKKDATYIMFLATYPAHPADLLNPEQGAYEVIDNSIISHEENHIKLDNNAMSKIEETYLEEK